MSESPEQGVPPVTRRLAQPDDEAFLFALYVQNRRNEMAAWGLAHALPDQLLRMQFTSREATYRTQYPLAEDHILLHDERPIGRVLIDRTGPAFVLVDIALVSDVQGRGIGTRELKALQEEAAGEDRPVRLSVVSTNPARRLYARLGFVSLGDDGVYEQMEWQSTRIKKG